MNYHQFHHLCAVLFATVAYAATTTGYECTAACACTSNEAAQQLWRSHRAARRMMVGLEQGALDSTSLEEAQSEVTTAIAELRGYRDQCAVQEEHLRTQCNSTTSSMALRRSCGCRPHRLLDLTRGISRRLDDAAAGVLFGDGEENMMKLSSASSYMLHSLSRVGSELERLGRACNSDSAAAKATDAGGGKRRGNRRIEVGVVEEDAY